MFFLSDPSIYFLTSKGYVWCDLKEQSSRKIKLEAFTIFFFLGTRMIEARSPLERFNVVVDLNVLV
jgi:hypothetical protein